MNTSWKAQLTASIQHTDRLWKPEIPIYNSTVLATAGRKLITTTTTITRGEEVTNRYAFPVSQKYWTCNDFAFIKTSWVSKLADKTTRSFPKGKQTQAVNVYFSKAIDTVDHDILINKLC